MFNKSNYSLYVLGNYSAHITDKVREVLLAKAYILDIIGGGITGDIQCNDTHVHHLFKKKYQDFVAELMNEMLLQYTN